MADLKAHLERNLKQAEQLGQTERVKRIKARLVDLEAAEEAPVPSMANTKDELLEAADAAGVDVDESMKKREILKVLEAE